MKRRSWLDWDDTRPERESAPIVTRVRARNMGDWLTPFAVTPWRPETEAAFRVERARARLVGRMGT